MKDAKRLVIIYLLGVLIGWFMGLSLISNHNGNISKNTTYGDVAFISVMSLFSWADVAAISLYRLSELELWDKEI